MAREQHERPAAAPLHVPADHRHDGPVVFLAAGGNAFAEYQLPEAVLRLKQGFGRLIRTREDRGTVVILDPRMLTKPYGRVFLDSLPPARVVIEPRG